MDMAVEVEQRAEPLQERDGPTLRVVDAVGTCPSTLPGQHLAKEDAEDLSEQIFVACKEEPDPMRQRQYPLPVRHRREDAVDKKRSGTGHAAARARRTKSAGLARKCDEPFLGAGITSDAHEAMAEQSASEELFELALDETRIAVSMLRAFARTLE
jgi:hypothetical protein